MIRTGRGELLVYNFYNGFGASSRAGSLFKNLDTLHVANRILPIELY